MNSETPQMEKSKRKAKPSPRALKRKALRKLARLDSTSPILPQVRRHVSV